MSKSRESEFLFVVAASVVSTLLASWLLAKPNGAR